MVTVGFVVEGPSDKKLVESESFQAWLREECGLDLVPPVVDAGGNGEMCSRKINDYIKDLRVAANPDKVVVLADLDPNAIKLRKYVLGETLGGLNLHKFSLRLGISLSTYFR